MRETHKPDGTIDYEIVKVATNQGAATKVFDFSEAVKDLQGGAAQVTIEKSAGPLTELDPGEYRLNIKVTDKLRSPNQTLTQSATFTVN